MSTTLPEKILVIGLDGADLELITPWIDAGDLPNLASIRDAGTSGLLQSVIPPVSAPAWATFMTGRNPGRHGVFGFVTERPGTGETTLVSLGSIRGTKLWDAFSAAGRRVVVVNVPITWPPPEIDGVFVSGMLTPPGRPFTWPAEVQAEIEAKVPDYRIDIDRGLFDDQEVFREHLFATAKARGEVIRLAMDRGEWDFLLGVFTNTDRMQHHFWRKEREKIRDLYRLIDGEIGKILDRVDRDKTLVVVLSDHGFTTTDRRIYMNRWLREEGYLGVRRVSELTDDYQKRRFNWFMDEPEETRRKEKLATRILKRLGLRGELAIDWEKTRAYLYSSDTRGIHLNVKGRQPQGTVEESRYEPLRDEIIGKLRALTFPETGEAVFESVEKREDLYDGPYLESAPDILTVPERDRYRVVTKIDRKGVFRQHRTPDGYHRKAGVLFAAGPGVARGGELADAGIADVLPTLLYAAGIPTPERADGRVLRELFTDELLASRTEERAPEAPDAAAEDVRLSDEEDQVLRQTLEGLGYL